MRRMRQQSLNLEWISAAKADGSGDANRALRAKTQNAAFVAREIPVAQPRRRVSPSADRNARNGDALTALGWDPHIAVRLAMQSEE